MNFEVDRLDLHNTRLLDSTPRSLEPGEVRLRIERFALTSNNISYAITGDMLDYWGFFPAEHPWGRIPAIGIASIVESAHPDLAAGGKYFGFYPMGDELISNVEPAGEGAFRDVGPHRARHADTYTEYRDFSGGAFNDELDVLERVDEYLLLWGMFMTAYLIDIHLEERHFEGASAVIITSASSKTSLSLASRISNRKDVRAIGLTSERNRSFVESLGLFDRVSTYDRFDELDFSARTGLVDVAGNSRLCADIRRLYADKLAFSLSVGATHWDKRHDEEARITEPPAEFFFAPGQRAKLTRKWGAHHLEARINRAYREFLDHSVRWLTVKHSHGASGIKSSYDEILSGSADPSLGLICLPGAQVQ